MGTSLLGMLLVLGAAILWGTTGTSQALAPVGSTPLVIGTMRITVGSIVLILLALGRRSFRPCSHWPILPTLMAIITTVLYQVCFFGGTSLTGVAVGTVVGIGATPIFAGLLEVIFLRQRLTGRWWAATVLAIIGCSLLLATGETLTIDPLGILLALGAGLSYATFTMVSKVVLEYQRPDALMAVVFGFSALLMSPLLLFNEIAWIATPDGRLVALYLGIVTIGVSYSLFGRGLRLVPAATAATLTLAEPMTAALLGIFLLKEMVPPLGMLGIVLIFLGLAMLAFGPKAKSS
ncbi:MAG: EamA family transporter [Anaerolineae bacterium]|nr:EamA family transporter [Anaerolineae bacterium]